MHKRGLGQQWPNKEDLKNEDEPKKEDNPRLQNEGDPINEGDKKNDRNGGIWQSGMSKSLAVRPAPCVLRQCTVVFA